MDITIQAAAVAERCADAYSADAYQSWPAVAKALLKHGLSELQAEAVMRSKWARWARDVAGRDENAPARVLLDFVKKHGMAEVAALTLETFGEPR